MGNPPGTGRMGAAGAASPESDPAPAAQAESPRPRLQLADRSELAELADDLHRQAFEGAVTGMAFIAPDGTYLMVNRALCEVIGRSCDEVLGARWEDFTHPDDIQVSWDHMASALDGQAPSFQLEKRYLHADGQIVTALVTTSLVTDGDGEPSFFFVQIQDQSDRARAEAALSKSEERLQMMLQHTSDVISVLDAEGRIRFSSPSAHRILGYQVGSDEGWPAIDLVHPDDASRVLAVFLEHIGRPGSTVLVQCRLKANDGTYHHVELAGNNLLHDRAVGGFVVTVRDISARRRAEMQIAGQARILEMVARGEPLSDILGSLTALMEEHADGALCAVLLYDEATNSLRHGSAPSLPEEFRKAIDGLPVGPRVGSCGTAAFLGQPVVVTDIATDPLWEGYRELALAHGLRASWSMPISEPSRGRVLGTFATYYREPRGPRAEDWAVARISAHLAALAIERRQAEERLAYQALHDPLTGLPNRALLLDRLDHALARLRRSPTRLAVLFCDLDRFKEVNDAHGHVVGDRLLMAAAERLRSSVAVADTVARLGGDEFVVLCEDIVDESAARAIGERIVANFAAPFDVDGVETTLSASVGIALASRADERVEDVVGAADAAMYRAKKAGRNRVESFGDIEASLPQS